MHFWQECDRSDAVLFSAHSFRRDMELAFPRVTKLIKEQASTTMIVTGRVLHCKAN